MMIRPTYAVVNVGSHGKDNVCMSALVRKLPGELTTVFIPDEGGKATHVTFPLDEARAFAMRILEALDGPTS